MGAVPAAGLTDDPLADLAGHPHPADADPHRQIVTPRPLAIPQGGPHDARHPKVALHPGGRRPIASGDADVAEQVGQHRHLHTRLTERRENLLDVAEEQAVGPDHEDALAVEREPVGVEEVGSAVEGDDGLAGSRAALHDEHTGQRCADDLVLLGLDRADDVGEPAGAVLLERGDERTLAAELPAR